MPNNDVLQLARCVLRPCKDEAIQGPIFVSYRQDDFGNTTRYLGELLAQRFGKDQVFLDVESVLPGDHYWDEIRTFLDTCSAVLVVIGPKWLERDPDTGKRRIDNPRDPVRREIEMALERYPRVRVIPVLVEGARMPTARDLPRPIRPLAHHMAQVLPAGRFATSAAALMDRLESPPPKRFASWAAINELAPTWALLTNAALRPLWSNVLLPLVLLIAGFTIRGKSWLVPIAVVLWVVLATVSLFDKQQARCVRRCLHGPTYTEDHIE